MPNEQKKKIKKYLTLITVITILFGSDSENKSCGEVQIKTWQVVTVFLLLNHFIGRPRDLHGPMTLIFGYYMINGITFIWSLKGTFDLMEINANSPNCLKNTEKTTIVFEIILSFLLCFPLCLVVLGTVLSCTCFPLYCLVYLLCGNRIRRSRLF